MHYICLAEMIMGLMPERKVLACVYREISLKKRSSQNSWAPRTSSSQGRTTTLCHFDLTLPDFALC